MASGRCSYIMTERVFKLVSSREGALPRCRNCGKVLSVGSLTLSKPTSGRGGRRRRRMRYCEECARLLKIWRKNHE